MVVATSTGIDVQLVTSKSRVAPLVKQSIPRLELLAALILARLMQSVQSALGGMLLFDSVHCWTDSQVTLYWIRGEQHEWKQFVQNRVNEIRKIVPPLSWAYCPTSSNPADLPSHGVSAQDLQSSIWFTGPNWLREQSTQPHEECADVNGLSSECSFIASSELKQSVRTSCLTSGSSDFKGIGTVMDVTRFSSLNKLLRVTAYVLKFLSIARGQAEMSPLESKELEQARMLWIQDVQQKVRADAKFDRWVREFGIFHDDQGTLLCGGRLQNAALTYGQLHPLLLHIVTQT